MSTARDELISDWRANLATAEAEPVSSSPRRAWLARVRMRLYRFLLALYGDGIWRSDEHSATKQSDSAGFSSARVQELVGKPAKDIGKIRAVLKAVSSCQDHRPEAGLLTANEVLASNWFVVAAASANLDLRRCLRMLECHRITCRIEPRGDDLTIEVPASQRGAAIALLDQWRPQLRQRHIRRVPRRLSTVIAGLLLLFVGPVFCLLAFVAIASAMAGRPVDADTFNRLILACVATMGIAVGALTWAAWRAHERSSA